MRGVKASRLVSSAMEDALLRAGRGDRRGPAPPVREWSGDPRGEYFGGLASRLIVEVSGEACSEASVRRWEN